jgi:hypothetical protein
MKLVELAVRRREYMKQKIMSLKQKVIKNYIRFIQRRKCILEGLPT